MINDILCIPFLLRAALDTTSSEINTSMEFECALKLAELARKPVPSVVKRAYEGLDLEFGPNYIIPSIFDPNLLTTLAPAIAKKAIEEGVAHYEITDWEEYKYELKGRISHTHF